jgi:hypothetical protein
MDVLLMDVLLKASDPSQLCCHGAKSHVHKPASACPAGGSAAVVADGQ